MDGSLLFKGLLVKPVDSLASSFELLVNGMDSTIFVASEVSLRGSEKKHCTRSSSK
jgi:hypothetical protein